MNTNPSKDNLQSDSKINRGFNRGFWGTLIILILAVGTLEIYAALNLHQQLEEVVTLPPSTEKETLASKQTSHQTPKPISQWRQTILQNTFQAATQEYSLLNQELKAKVKSTFDHSRQNIDQQINTWADWYFSVVGEYARLGHLGAQLIGKSNLEDYMLEQLTTKVFKPAGVFEDLKILNEETQKRYQQQHQKVITHLDKVLRRHQDPQQTGIKPQFVNSKLKQMDQLDHIATLHPIALLARLTALTTVKSGLKFLVSRSAVKATSGVLLKGGAKGGAKVATKTVLKKGGAKLAVSGAAKAGTKGAALASGVSATAICAPLGPFAAVCGVTAAVGTWFAVDKVVVEADELLHREEFIKQSKKEFAKVLDDLEVEITQELNNYHQKVIETLVATPANEATKNTQTIRLVDQLKTTMED